MDDTADSENPETGVAGPRWSPHRGYLALAAFILPLIGLLMATRTLGPMSFSSDPGCRGYWDMEVSLLSVADNRVLDRLSIWISIILLLTIVAFAGSLVIIRRENRLIDQISASSSAAIANAQEGHLQASAKRPPTGSIPLVGGFLISLALIGTMMSVSSIQSDAILGEVTCWSEGDGVEALLLGLFGGSTLLVSAVLLPAAVVIARRRSRFIANAARPSTQTVINPGATDGKTDADACQFCGADRPAFGSFCPHCGQRIA